MSIFLMLKTYQWVHLHAWSTPCTFRVTNLPKLYRSHFWFWRPCSCLLLAQVAAMHMLIFAIVCAFFFSSLIVIQHYHCYQIPNNRLNPGYAMPSQNRYKITRRYLGWRKLEFFKCVCMQFFYFKKSLNLLCKLFFHANFFFTLFLNLTAKVCS